MKTANVCETCQRKFYGPSESDGGDGGLQEGTLTGTSGQGIINEGAPSCRVFSSLCPQCREEAWEAETHSQPAYPYKH